MALQGKLPHPKRFITTHNEQGKAAIDTTSPSDVPFYQLPGDDNASFAHCYVTTGFPVDLAGDKDIGVYRDFLTDPPGLTVSGGSVLRYVDMPPGGVSPMHRTASLDYGVVLEGEVELVLDSGETRVMRRGDICVQRATMHAWRNRSQTEWVRMLYVLLPAGPLVVGGNEVGEDYGGMRGVKPSE